MTSRTVVLIAVYIVLCVFPVQAESTFPVACENVQYISLRDRYRKKTLVSIQLSTESTLDFKKITSQNVGQTVTITANSECVLSTPVQAEIFSGRIVIDTSSEQEALKLANQICAAKVRPSATVKTK